MGTRVVNNSTFTNNVSAEGAAIFALNGTLTVNNGTLSGNRAFGYGETRGGALQVGGFGLSPSVTLNNTTITGNTAINWSSGGTNRRRRRDLP